MKKDFSQLLNPERALIFRIVHKSNMEWILQHGLACGNDPKSHYAKWINIGNPELIQKRAIRPVHITPYGYLNDYVPFYFTPFSPMMKNIRSGWGGIVQRPNEDIVILVSSLHKIQNEQLDFVFTDGHAYYQWSNFYNNLNDLNQVSWGLLQARDFTRDQNNPEKFERYQAEALIYQNCPLHALLGIVCYNEDVRKELCLLQNKYKCSIRVEIRPTWYFS